MKAFKYGFWGCLGVAVGIFVVVQIGGCLLLANLSSSSTQFSITPVSGVKTTPTVGASPENPAPLNQWVQVKRDVEIRLLSISQEPHYVTGNDLFKNLYPDQGKRFYVVEVEGRFNGSAGDSHSFTAQAFHALDSDRQLVAAHSQLYIYSSKAFNKTVFGGGSTKGDVLIESAGLTALYYQPWLSLGDSDRIFFAVPSGL